MSSRKHQRPSTASGNPRRPPGRSAGPDGGAEALQVITAVQLTGEDFPGELGATYSAACAAVGVQPHDAGYGLALAQDSEGACWTVVTTDVRGVDTVRSLWEMGMSCGYEAEPGTVAAVRPGWPLECVLSVAGLGPPHDPPGIPAHQILRPPTPRSPARRRGMADILASELADLQGRTLADYLRICQEAAYDLGDNDPEPPPPRLIDMRAVIEPDHPAHQHIEHALAAAWKLAATGKPPPGSVRAHKAHLGNARLVRANGDGWTLTARTDGPAVLLTDQLHGVVIDLDGTPELAGLLTALTAAAARCPR